MRKDPSKMLAAVAAVFGALALYSAGNQPSTELGGQYRTFAVLATIAVLFLLAAIFVRMGRNKD